MGATTTERSEAVRLADDDWTVGGLPREGFASTWFVTTLEHVGIDHGVGALIDETVDSITTAIRRYRE